MKPLLGSISEQLKLKLYSMARTKNFTEGEIIFLEGQRAEFLPIVVHGTVKVVQYPKVGREIIIDIFKSGEMFAVPAAFDGNMYPATAIAMSDSTLLLITRRDFLKLLEESTEFSFQVISWMAEMLRRKTALIETFSAESPSRRIVKTLLRLYSRECKDPTKPFKITLRRQDIAEMTGLTVETTIRTIRKLAEQKLIRIEHGKIFIDSPEALSVYLASFVD